MNDTYSEMNSINASNSETAIPWIRSSRQNLMTIHGTWRRKKTKIDYYITRI